MSTEAMREYLLKQYPGSQNWANRVRKMSAGQVFAVYMRMTNKSPV